MAGLLETARTLGSRTGKHFAARCDVAVAQKRPRGYGKRSAAVAILCRTQSDRAIGHSAMARIEKTVFISYRRTDESWGLAIFQDLTQHGYDVFIDYDGIASGNFEAVILENIRARAHFLVLLNSTALERCGDPEDWMRREIEAGLDSQRNIVPLMLEGFDFVTPATANQHTGKLAALKKYNGLEIPKARYFSSEMERLRNKFLNVSVDAVLHPASDPAQQAATEQKDKATERADGEERYFEEMERLADAFIQKKGGDIEKSGKDIRSELTKLGSTDLEGIFASRPLPPHWTGIAGGWPAARASPASEDEAHPRCGDGFSADGYRAPREPGRRTLPPDQQPRYQSRSGDINRHQPGRCHYNVRRGLPGAERETWKVKKLIFNSPITELDATLSPTRPASPGCRDLPDCPGASEFAMAWGAVYVVGHPQGGELLHSRCRITCSSTGISGSCITGHRQSPAAPGARCLMINGASSPFIMLTDPLLRKLNGKPGRYEASEGINILAIVQEIRRVLSAT